MQVGGILSTAFAALVLGFTHWRMVFVLPSLLVCLAGVMIYSSLVEDPAALPFFPTLEMTEMTTNTTTSTSPSLTLPGTGPIEMEKKRPSPSFLQVMRVPLILNLGMCYFCVKLIRYTLLFWLPYYLFKTLGYDSQTAAGMSALFDIGGAFGSVLCGYLCDRFARGRRSLVAAPMCLAAGASLYMYSYVSSWGIFVNCVAMAVVGLLVAGPDSVLGAAATQDCCERAGQPAAITTASGIVNGMGSAGAVLQGVLTAYLSHRFGWDSLFYALVILSLSATLSLAPVVLAEFASSSVPIHTQPAVQHVKLTETHQK